MTKYVVPVVRLRGVSLQCSTVLPPCRPRQPSRDCGQPTTGFLLPSPSRSLLGPRKTLSLLAAGEASGRPVRKTRGRAPRERARDRVHGRTTEEAGPVANDNWWVYDMVRVVTTVIPCLANYYKGKSQGFPLEGHVDPLPAGYRWEVWLNLRSCVQFWPETAGPWPSSSLTTNQPLAAVEANLTTPSPPLTSKVQTPKLCTL